MDNLLGGEKRLLKSQRSDIVKRYAVREAEQVVRKKNRQVFMKRHKDNKEISFFKK